MPNFVEHVNLQIHDFVESMPRLRPGTGSYSTPFRGTLFGCDRAEEVEARLATRSVSLLFLGSNPNVRRSLNMIANDYQRIGDWDSFLAQSESGLFGEMDFDTPAKPTVGWSPLSEPRQGHWKFFAEAIEAADVPMDTIAMQNVIPWGSGSLQEFVHTLRRVDTALLKDILTFSSKLLDTTICALRPRALLAPLSLCRNNALEEILKLQIPVSRSNDHDSYAGGSDGGGFTVLGARLDGPEGPIPVVITSHPSSLRYQRKDRRESIKRAITEALRIALASPCRASALEPPPAGFDASHEDAG